MEKEVCFIGILKEGRILMKVSESDLFMGKLSYPSPMDFGLNRADFDYDVVNYRCAVRMAGSIIDIVYKIKIYKISIESLNLDDISFNNNVDEIGYIWLDISKIHTFDLSPLALKVIDKMI